MRNHSAGKDFRLALYVDVSRSHNSWIRSYEAMFVSILLSSKINKLIILRFCLLLSLLLYIEQRSLSMAVESDCRNNLYSFWMWSVLAECGLSSSDRRQITSFALHWMGTGLEMPVLRVCWGLLLAHFCLVHCDKGYGIILFFCYKMWFWKLHLWLF